MSYFCQTRTCPRRSNQFPPSPSATSVRKWELGSFGKFAPAPSPPGPAPCLAATLSSGMAANIAAGINLGTWIEQRGVRECLQWFTREKQWINEIHLQLCRVPAPTFLEQERAAWFLDAVPRLGLGRLHRPRRQRDRGCRASGPYVALTAHLDTVIAPRNKDDITVEADGRFCGPGVSDNGAGLAALLAVARAWKTCPRLAGSRRRACCWWPTSAKKAKATCWACGTSANNRRWPRKIEAFLVVDGANTDHITNRALGSRRFEIAFTGPGGHSWSDYGVGNPLHALCRAVALFAETRIDGAPKSAFNVGLIEGGSSVNAIPQMARAKVDIRSESNPEDGRAGGPAVGGAVDRARELENQRATGGKVTAKLKEIGSRPAAALPENAPPFSSTCAPWTRTWASARTWIAPPPTPTFRCRWASRPSPSAAGGVGRRRPHHPGMVPAGRARPGPQAHLPDPAPADARTPNPGPGGSGTVKPPPGGSGAGLQHGGLGRHVRPGESGAARRLAAPVPGAAVLPGHGGAAGSVPRGLEGALSRGRPSAAGALAGVFLFSGYLFQTLGLRLTTAPNRPLSPD